MAYPRLEREYIPDSVRVRILLGGPCFGQQAIDQGGCCASVDDAERRERSGAPHLPPCDPSVAHEHRSRHRGADDLALALEPEPWETAGEHAPDEPLRPA